MLHVTFPSFPCSLVAYLLDDHACTLCARTGVHLVWQVVEQRSCRGRMCLFSGPWWRAEEPSRRLTHGFATYRMARVMGLLQASLRRYCLILREHKTASSQAETSGRRDRDLPAGETSGATCWCEQKPKGRFAAILALLRSFFETRCKGLCKKLIS